MMRARFRVVCEMEECERGLGISCFSFSVALRELD